ncbi:uncharacterized protein LOC144663434 isoform X1 [Oculina patagonica]
MACRHIFIITILLMVSVMFRQISSQQCGIDTYSIYQMMLKGHTFETFKARPLSMDCREACNSDVRCQSYNYVFFKDICELNNRTKEARPEDFVKDSDRYYMTKAPNRVPLGSIPKLPADSCGEIKASEGGQAVSGSYWLDLEKNGGLLKLYCDMTIDGALPIGWYSYRPGHSCKHIRDSGYSKGDGEYWIDPEENGNPLKVSCDMTTDSGGWLLVSNVVIDDSSPFQLSVETSYRGISSYNSNKTFLTKTAMKELRTHLPFTQLRFHCSKQHHGRTFHVTTAANSTGEAVVQYLSGQTDVQPDACGSFVRMEDDDSVLAGVCHRWGFENGLWEIGKWGAGYDETRLYDHTVFVFSLSHWVLTEDGSRLDCDDRRTDGESSGDFWKVFVR